MLISDKKIRLWMSCAVLIGVGMAVAVLLNEPVQHERASSREVVIEFQISAAPSLNSKVTARGDSSSILVYFRYPIYFSLYLPAKPRWPLFTPPPATAPVSKAQSAVSPARCSTMPSCQWRFRCPAGWLGQVARKIQRGSSRRQEELNLCSEK
jgi:hypothetical protein